MNNLNQSQKDELSSLLDSRSYEEQDMISIVKLYILVRKGRSVDINLEPKGVSSGHPLYFMLRADQTKQMISAYDNAMSWFGLNYKK